MSIYSVLCGHANGYVSFYCGDLSREAWTDHLALATRFDPIELLYAEQLAASYGGKIMRLDWLELWYPTEATATPIRCTLDEFAAWR